MMIASLARSASRFLRPGALSLAACLASLGAASEVAAQVDGCTDAMYLDRTGASADRTFTWDYSFESDPERCIVIRVGQSVRWQGNFGDHPLDPDEGDRPNPIANHGNGLVTFDTPGTYGYRCNFHLAMRGAVKVVAATAVPALGTSYPGAAWAMSLSSLVLAVWWLGSRRRG